MPAWPEGTARLFDDPTQFSGEVSDFVVGKLLEEGDRQDLRALVEEVGEGRLAEWVAARGPRQLSRRSLAFWTRLLALPAPRHTANDDDLWPL